MKITSPLILLVVFIAGLAVAGLVWLLDLRPTVSSPLVAASDGSLTIDGNFFGPSAVEKNAVVLQDGTSLPVQSWSDQQIIVRLPSGMSEGDLVIRREFLGGTRQSTPASFRSPASGLPSQPYGYQVPVQADSPWPTFRRDQRNTGRSDIPSRYDSSLQPWSFHTLKGVFSTPVIDGLGHIYVGSADHYFYALNPDGSLAWKYQTGEIIDSAAALSGSNRPGEQNTITFISGDGYMYHALTDPAIPDPADRLVWKYQAELRPEISYNRWFEGNVAVGYDGALYAGNTNFLYYAINLDGTKRWTYPTASNNWSQAAFGPDGSIYWGSVDTYIHAVSAAGRPLWSRRTLGFIAASAALGSDGTVYIGSFDSNLYALDPHSGHLLWSFSTQDHIYASVALGEDTSGKTQTIYLASTDGFIYALDTSGKLKWKYDTGDPVRSSPVVGIAPDGGEVVYLGNGSGILYAINGADGSLHWAFNTTPNNPELRDRNDLNGSPALGLAGIVIGGEHGDIWFVPYDYCLHSQDARCVREADLKPAGDFRGFQYVTPGGSVLPAIPDDLPAATMITLRLVVRQNGETLDARVCNSPIGCPKDALQVKMEPPTPFTLEHSSDGKYIMIRPDGFLGPGVHYKMSVSGYTYVGGMRIGNLTLGGRQDKSFESQFEFNVENNASEQPVWQISPQQTTAFEWTRLAAPIPTMLPSLNQIGFDYIDWIVGAIKIDHLVEGEPQRLVLWAVGAKRDPSGRLAADPQSEYVLPLSGMALGDSFILSNRNFKMPITGISIPFNRFELRGQMQSDFVVRPGATIFADTQVLSIPTFGPYLVIAGLANNWYEKMLVSGTYVTRAYSNDQPSAMAPDGLTFSPMDFVLPTKSSPGSLTIRVNSDPHQSSELKSRRLALVLIDPVAYQAISLDYRSAVQQTNNPDGSIQVTLTITAGTELPPHLQAFLMVDVYPAYSQAIR